jgi:hypothetical protein
VRAPGARRVSDAPVRALQCVHLDRARNPITQAPGGVGAVRCAHLVAAQPRLACTPSPHTYRLLRAGPHLWFPGGACVHQVRGECRISGC